MDKALQILTTLTGVLRIGLELSQEFERTVKTARDEGRDITDAELDALDAKRNAALDALSESLKG